MPLPAALLAKLAKRGLVEQPSSTDAEVEVKKTAKDGEEVEEEVFAEDYDDPNKPEPEPVQVETEAYQETTTHEFHQNLAAQDVSQDPLFFETTACPERSNPYHECLAYCRKRYGLKEWNPHPDMLRRRDRMLSKYPLPVGWLEVGDFDSNRFYYWNESTNEVSWLSPTHPKAFISTSAESLGIIGKIGNLDSDGEEPREEQEEDVISDSGSGTSLSDEEEDFVEKLGRAKRKAAGRQIENKKRGHAKDDLDPMDPASYSDIPRGGWNEGLDTRGKAKTGVDVTASGPLFQQRPYPSPGDILRANQSTKKKK